MARKMPGNVRSSGINQKYSNTGGKDTVKKNSDMGPAFMERKPMMLKGMPPIADAPVPACPPAMKGENMDSMAGSCAPGKPMKKVVPQD